MARTIIQLYRGTTAQNDAFTGSAGELSFDTTTNQVRVHDGTTAGGHIVGSSSSGGYHPDLFDWKWADHQINDVQWLRADTFSWQSGAVYEVAYRELLEDILKSSTWSSVGLSAVYTKTDIPNAGDTVYSDTDCTTSIGTVTSYDAVNEEIVYNGNTYHHNGDNFGLYETETIAGISISFILSTTGRKIVIDSLNRSAVESIYNATGVAWYYILDNTNKRFKLPRTQFGFTGLRDTVGKYVPESLPNIKGATSYADLGVNSASGAFYLSASGRGITANHTGSAANDLCIDASLSSSVYQDSAPVQPKATQMYLYFYVGNFTQTALENTAGLNAELFNGKVDIGHEVVEFQAPNAGNNYTWYRIYADGWVEQGGTTEFTSNPISITLPVEMMNTNYTATATLNYSSASGWGQIISKSTTGISVGVYYGNGNASGTGSDRFVCWQVSGMVA